MYKITTRTSEFWVSLYKSIPEKKEDRCILAGTTKTPDANLGHKM